jgi:dephospho-CoA kinase
MERWGITGLMGSGKSEAKRYLKSKGYPVSDADDVARQLLSSEFPENLAKLQEIFGTEVLSKNNNVDRGLIRKAISHNPTLRQEFEGWLHPLIRLHNRQLIARWESQGHQLCFIEGTRLVESGAHLELAGLILVTTPESLRVERLKTRGEMTAEDQKALLKTQDEELMRKFAKVVWENSLTPANLHRQIDTFLFQKKK